MIDFDVHTVDTAPISSKPVLEGLERNLGMIPNLAATMAENPLLLDGFLHIRKLLHSGSFAKGEIEVLALTNAYENGCRYCMALHSHFALEAGVSVETVEALRKGQDPVEPRLRALSRFSRKLIKHRGNVLSEDVEAFVGSGFSRCQVLEVVLGIAVSILPNFTHHITGAPIDDIFQHQLWEAPVSV